ncbi:hypothetical protein [Paenibacillus sp. OSY-SE]|uniref:hypothetical protein n=1 Tax=Paenibacillus sp. OSY-SE TaxID=1196323 RepID=UPI00037B2D50|nr:hypothetical protein [Paenibacillus sp. OSY-SE]
MNDAIVGALVSGIVGVIGVLIGGILTYKLGHKSEKMMIRMKIKVEKIQNTQKILLDMARQMGILSVAVKNFEFGKINQEIYCKTSNDVQEEFSHLIRSIRVNEFVIKNHKDQLDTLIDEFITISDMLYERYYDPNCQVKNYDPEEITFEVINKKISRFMLTTIDIKDELSDRIDKELTT